MDARFRILLGLCVLSLSACVSNDELEGPPSRTSAETARAEAAQEEETNTPAPATDSRIRTTALSAADVTRLTSGNRPALPFFGAIIHADQVDLLNGKASGNVFVDGRALNATNEHWPRYVLADEVTVDLANEKVTLSGFPRMEWPMAHLRATSPLTTIYLSREKYRVDGPTLYGISF